MRNKNRKEVRETWHTGERIVVAEEEVVASVGGTQVLRLYFTVTVWVDVRERTAKIAL